MKGADDDDEKQHLETFQLRFQRISDVRFVETSIPLSGSIFGNEEAVLEFADPYLVSLTQSTHEADTHTPTCIANAPTEHSTPLSTSTPTRSKRDVGWWQCSRVRALLVATNNKQSNSPSVVYFRVTAWPIRLGLGPEKSASQGLLKHLSICLPHARVLFGLPISGVSGQKRGWTPPICTMYDDWKQECQLTKTMPWGTYMEKSGERIRQAARDTMRVNVTASPLELNTETPQHLRQRNFMDFHSEYPDNEQAQRRAPRDGDAAFGENCDAICVYPLLRTCECLAGCLVTISIPVYDFAQWMWARHYCCCPATGQHHIAHLPGFEGPVPVPRARNRWYKERRSGQSDGEQLIQHFEGGEDEFAEPNTDPYQPISENDANAPLQL